MKRDFSAYAADFERDGVAFIEKVFNEEEMRLLEEAFAYKLGDSASKAQELYPNVLYSLGISIEHPVYERLLRDSPMADLVQGLFGGSEVWYHNDQLWMKEGGSGRRTPWHQDSGYEHAQGAKIVNLWIPLESLPAENVLETIPGTHKGPTYNPPVYDPADDTAPTYDDPAYPRMPDIEAERSKWTIFSTAMKRGDVLAFHHAILHGGAPVFAGQKRRSFTFRFFGDDATYRKHGRRIYSSTGAEEFREENLAVGMAGLKPGDPIHRSPAFRKVRPWTPKS